MGSPNFLHPPLFPLQQGHALGQLVAELDEGVVLDPPRGEEVLASILALRALLPGDDVHVLDVPDFHVAGLFEAFAKGGGLLVPVLFVFLSLGRLVTVGTLWGVLRDSELH